MLRASLLLAASNAASNAQPSSRSDYLRARKDGGWDAHTDAAAHALVGDRFATLDAGVERAGRGVVMSAAGDAEFATVREPKMVERARA